MNRYQISIFGKKRLIFEECFVVTKNEEEKNVLNSEEIDGNIDKHWIKDEDADEKFEDRENDEANGQSVSMIKNSKENNANLENLKLSLNIEESEIRLLYFMYF